jgi:hypothetical protein
MTENGAPFEFSLAMTLSGLRSKTHLFVLVGQLACAVKRRVFRRRPGLWLAG